ncbi:hypothetical protein QE428_002595 [Microbacterium sp. SORGH_AS 505]|uniref:hypothetical protein n=1 Tax=Microbacterium sp. SORGH_AS_0505 TaxID=3041770 RepID=UPI002783F944|nr:hypothetical protein [Microbacterium sp. SORGH_AS_0505]MDQ1127562.1 hypothetical protein [Microbacterium sp. SORGH_AS_0505]
MSAVDFAEWAAPHLVLTFGEHTFRVTPPTTGEVTARVLALAVVAEVELGLVTGPVPDAIEEIVNGIGPDEHPALREAYGEMKDLVQQHKLLPASIDRAAVYAIFFWARGREYADWIAELIWTRIPDAKDEAERLRPKG